jgi:putative CocE/NonD family hydrolase
MFRWSKAGCAACCCFFQGLLSMTLAGGATIERDVAVKMRDGTVLRADIYRPNVAGPHPVLLVRTPYNKLRVGDFGLRAAESGYIAVVQDTRGRFNSEGDWYPFANEERDGYDSVEWAASLAGSNGKVGLFGGSYGGATTLLGALGGPPHLAGFVSIEIGDSFYDGFTYRGGAFQQWLTQTWTTMLALDTLERAARKAADVRTWAWALPLTRYPILQPPAGDALAPYYRDWLRHPSYDSYWKQWSFEDRYARVTVPGLHVGGWYDVFGDAPARVFNGMQAKGANEAARRNQRLILGPWSHGPLNARAGEIDFGPVAKLDPTEVGLRWFDRILRGVRSGEGFEPPVRLFIMGENRWRNENEWPLARAQETRFFLHSGGKANSVRGSGSLDRGRGQSEPFDEFVYDPANPVPTRGGGLCCGGILAGAVDQRPIESREDVLVYTTAAFDRPVEATGRLRAELYVSSSAVDTDFTARVIDVWPNGFAQNVADGVLRLRYRHSLEKPEFLTPGEVARIHIELSATSNLFRPGHRLRLLITSSDYPRYDRNLNTGDEQAFGTHMVKAVNRVYHDREHASALVIPIVPR